MFSGGAIRDLVTGWADAGLLGVALQSPASGYGAVYHIEIALLFVSHWRQWVGWFGAPGDTSARMASVLSLADFPS